MKSTPLGLTAKPCSVACTASLVELLPVFPMTVTLSPNLLQGAYGCQLMPRHDKTAAVTCNSVLEVIRPRPEPDNAHRLTVWAMSMICSSHDMSCPSPVVPPIISPSTPCAICMRSASVMVRCSQTSVRTAAPAGKQHAAPVPDSRLSCRMHASRNDRWAGRAS